MSFKFRFTAVLAAAMTITFAGTQGSGARALAAEAEPTTTISDAATTDEVVPLFVEKEVVQSVPTDDSVDQAQAVADKPASLERLISQTDVSSPLDAELECLAGAIYFESRGEPIAGQLAVAQVIINRAESPRFPATYCGVVKQPSQFSFVKRGHMPTPRKSSAAWNRAKAIARIAHEGAWASAARDSLFFHATHVRPSWSGRKTALTTISSHVFYK